MMEPDWPGQLITTSAHGHVFKHDPGAKGGKVYDGEALIGTFSLVDAGDEYMPTGIYAAEPGEDAFTYVATYDGASVHLSARRAVSWSGTDEQTWAVAYAVRGALASLVERIGDTRKMLASEDSADLPGAVRESLANGNVERERLHAQLVGTFATLPEPIRPDMRNRQLTLPESDQ